MQLHGPESRSKFLSGRIAPALLFQDDFGQYWQQQVREPFTGYSFQRPDSKTFRFEVQQGDRPGFDGSTVDRAEIYETTGAGSATPNPLPQLTSLWFSGKLTIRGTNTSSFCVLAQFHATEDAGDISASPPMSIFLDASDQLNIETRTSSANPLVGNPPGTIHATSSFPRDTGVNMVGNIQFDHAGNGFLKVWRDGAQVVNYTGAIGYNDTLGPYFKAGIYRASNPAPLVTEWRNLEVSTSDLSDRILNPLP